MEKLSTKHNYLIKLLGYCSIGIGFVGMLFVVGTLLFTFIQSFFITDTQGVALVLPGQIPGIGFLSFWHWILAIFILATIHEFSHGVVARAHKIKVKSSGIFFFGPLFGAFVEPDEKKLSKKKDFVQYSMLTAGPVSNIITSFIFLAIGILIFAPIGSGMLEPSGIMIQDLDNQSFAYEKGLRPGMLITSVNGYDQNNQADMLQELKCKRSCDTGNLRLIANNTPYEIAPMLGYDENKNTTIDKFGFKLLTVETKKKENVSNFAYVVVFWLLDLFKWLYILSFGIGLMNLVPIFPFDGGRMSLTMFKEFFRDEKKALKVNNIISIIFVIILVILISNSLF
ncbi:M50 family metallopeptidase [Nanoarchaeota archaeon]